MNPSNFTIPFMDPRLSQSGRKSSIGRVASRVGFSQASKTAALLDEMHTVSAISTVPGPASFITQTIEEIENAVQAWHQMEHKKRIPSSSKPKSEKDKEKPKDASKDGMFGLFRKSECTDSLLHDLENVGLTYKGHNSSHTPAEVISSTDDKSSLSDVGTFTNPHDRLQSAIAALKTQHVALSGLIPFPDNSPANVHGSPLPSTVEEQSEGSHTPSRFANPIARKTWASTVTSLSDGGSIWFDAMDELDGAEEFFLDPPPLEAGAIEDRIPVLDGQSNSNVSGESSDTDEDEGMGRLSLAISERAVRAGAQEVVHRTSLPSGPVADEGSLFALFKKNVGKVHFVDVPCVELFLTPSMERTSLVLRSP
jgi:oxysterol-binding protein-related protein 3/6/7